LYRIETKINTASREFLENKIACLLLLQICPNIFQAFEYKEKQALNISFGEETFYHPQDLNGITTSLNKNSLKQNIGF
jgi:hypothetical protein